MTALPLAGTNVPQLAGRLCVPTYDRAAVSVGIMHLGVGGFHRSHQAMYLDRLMTSGRDLEWGVRGLGVLPGDRRIVDALNGQDGLYTLVIKHPDGRLEPRVIGSITGMVYVDDDPRAAVETLAAESVRIVSLTITEGGYLIDPVTGEFDVGHRSIQPDLQPGAEPRTAFGLITAALALRRSQGIAPFTVMSCDNVPGNGDVARRALVSFARLLDPAQAEWIAESVAFPSSMVDRITPGTTDADRDVLAEQFGVHDAWPVVCEPFTQWVLEDNFPTGRPAWEEVGVQLVRDVVPYELMKLRMLNAGHQVVGYLGALAGFGYCHEVCQDPIFRGFLSDFMATEAAPTLPPVPGVDLSDYRRTLIERFSNPYIGDTLARLCAETSDRIPKFLLPSVRHNLVHDGPIECSALVIAAWARYAEGGDDAGRQIEVVDPLREQLMAAAARQHEEPTAFLAQRAVFGDLVDNARFTCAYVRALDSLHTVGARATVEAWSYPQTRCAGSG
jgi:mannitol 2-dehydrogenase